MKHIKLVVAFLLVLSLCSFAVGVWIQVQSKAGKFKIVFPALPKESAKMIKTPSGNLTMNIFMLDAGIAEKDNKLYMVIYTDYPNDVINSGMRKGKVDTFLNNAIAGSVSNIKGRITKQENANYKTFPGKHTWVSFGDGKGTMEMKMFLIKNRMYITEVGYETGFCNKQHMGKFFNSFEVVGGK